MVKRTSTCDPHIEREIPSFFVHAAAVAAKGACFVKMSVTGAEKAFCVLEYARIQTIVVVQGSFSDQVRKGPAGEEQYQAVV